MRTNNRENDRRPVFEPIWRKKTIWYIQNLRIPAFFFLILWIRIYFILIILRNWKRKINASTKAKILRSHCIYDYYPLYDHWRISSEHSESVLKIFRVFTKCFAFCTTIRILLFNFFIEIRYIYNWMKTENCIFEIIDGI